MQEAAALAQSPRYNWDWRHFAALMTGNVLLALGPWSVRLADSGPVSAGFWRIALALPALALIARINRQPLTGFRTGTWMAVAGAGVFFALDLASWHIGIGQTRLGNATLLGNAGSIILMVWGIFALRRAPTRGEGMAIAAALGGTAILFGRSAEIDAATLIGDLLCLLAGLFYAGYILLIQRERVALGGWSLLFWSSLAGVPILLGLALLFDEPFWPRSWAPLVALAIGSQVVGQGLLVYSLRHFPPLLIGMVLLTQPIVSVLVGWTMFDEALTGWDVVGMTLVAGALVLARAGDRRD